MRKNNEYDLRFAKKQQVWFTFCEKTTSMIYVLWKNNDYDFSFVKKQ